MKKRLFYISLILAIAFTLTFVSARPSQGVCPITSNTNIAFYGQTGFGGVGDLSKSWVTHFLDWWKQQDSSISYAALDGADIKSDCNLANFPNLKVYIQPGGDAYYQQRTLSSAGKQALTNYINSGKGYVGICAGFYYTASDYWWQDAYYAHSYLLGAYPTVEGSIREIADYDENPGYALTPLSNGFSAIYYGGPTRGYEHTSLEGTPGTIDAAYTAFGNGMPAVIKYNNMLLNSVHLEAFENNGIAGLTTEQRIENYKYLANLINDVSRTNFYVPPYTNPPVCGDGICESTETWHNCLSDCAAPQCSDGIDNDGDTLIDFPDDLGCSSAEDNDETDVVGPTEIFSDGFESGISGWTTTAVSGGNEWTASTTNPYSGSYYAQSNPMSTNEPASILEKTISTSGYSNIKLSYYRKLVGLDSADEFKAMWYNGNSWQVLEQTGSNSANDASYIFKEFTLPASADNNANLKVRFECTAGAVSEFCRVDNVKLTAN